MPTTTYMPLANINTTANQNSLTFSSITASYAHLVLVIDGAATADAELRLRFNSDTTTNTRGVSTLINVGNPPEGANIGGAGFTNLGWMNAAAFHCIANIFEYTNTSRNKHIHTEFANVSSNRNSFSISRWETTSAINAITLFPSTGQFVAGTTATLYGILG